jgi:hypothetical protein
MVPIDTHGPLNPTTYVSGIAGSFPRASTCSPFKPRKSSPRCASTHALAPVRFGASHRGARATRASHDAATIIGDSVSGRSRTIETDAAGRARARERRVARRSGANKYLTMRSRGERTRRLTRDALVIAGQGADDEAREARPKGGVARLGRRRRGFASSRPGSRRSHLRFAREDGSEQGVER